jgi:CRP/FNR family transcriptional regulator, nitrogen fixation regulation protein
MSRLRRCPALMVVNRKLGSLALSSIAILPPRVAGLTLCKKLVSWRRAVAVVTKAFLNAADRGADRIAGEKSPPATLGESCHDVMTLTLFQRDQEICCQDARTDACFYLVSGSARRCVLRPDGRRQITDLLLPGDFFGFSLEPTHEASAEAVEDHTMVGVYPKPLLERLGRSSIIIAGEMHQAVSAEQGRQRAQCLILGRVSALHKVGAFLLHMQARLGKDGCGVTVLPFSRYDIADYLAISVETVCRALTDLRRWGYIRLHTARAYQINDATALGGGAMH